MTALHGIGFGGLFVLGFLGAMLQAYRIRHGAPHSVQQAQMSLRGCVLLMCIAVWLIVLSGTYFVYPEYKEATSIAGSSATELAKMRHIGRLRLGDWLDIVLFWKEYATWVAPIGMTMLAYLLGKHGAAIFRLRGLRQVMLAFIVVLIAVMAAAAVGGYALNHDLSNPTGNLNSRQARGGT